LELSDTTASVGINHLIVDLGRDAINHLDSVKRLAPNSGFQGWVCQMANVFEMQSSYAREAKQDMVQGSTQRTQTAIQLLDVSLLLTNAYFLALSFAVASKTITHRWWVGVRVTTRP